MLALPSVPLCFVFSRQLIDWVFGEA